MASLVGVIDAGHGGKDPGCRGHQAVEKELTLIYALDLAVELKKRGHQIILTRDDDRYLSLDERTKIANNHNPQPDFFLSIHFDSNQNPKAKGTWCLYHNKVYFQAGLTPKDQGYVISQEPSSLGRSLANTLTCYISRKAGTQFRQNQGRPFYWWNEKENQWKKEGQLYVLRHTKSCAVLCEVCFLSNQEDETRAITRDFQKKVISGMVLAIEEWGRKYLGRV